MLVQGSALKAALLVMKHVGGKIMLFSSHPPTIGELVTKRSGGLAGADGAGGGGRQQQQQPDREVELLKPASEVYQVSVCKSVRHIVIREDSVPCGEPVRRAGAEDFQQRSCQEVLRGDEAVPTKLLPSHPGCGA